MVQTKGKRNGQKMVKIILITEYGHINGNMFLTKKGADNYITHSNYIDRYEYLTYSWEYCSILNKKLLVLVCNRIKRKGMELRWKKEL